jgi:hypothetical protein
LTQDPFETPEPAETEGQWQIRDGRARPMPSGQPAFLSDPEAEPGQMVVALDYSNPFGQKLERIWFDGNVVYAVELGELDVDPSALKVAQEYQIVYAVELDRDGKPVREPDRVPGQYNIYDSVPGMPKYSPLWQFNYVVVPRDYAANTLRSERDCLDSGFPIQKSRVIEN